MPTIALDTIVQELLPETQNVPEDVVKTAIIKATRTFCLRSRVWRVSYQCHLNKKIGKIYLKGGEELVECEYIKVPIQSDVLARPVVIDSLNGFVDIQEDELKNVATTGTAVCSIMPLYSATSLDEALYRRWQTAIRNGTLFELRSMFGREWFEPNIAMAHRESFELEIAKAAHQAMNRYLKSPARPKKSRWL